MPSQTGLPLYSAIKHRDGAIECAGAARDASRRAASFRLSGVKLGQKRSVARRLCNSNRSPRKELLTINLILFALNLVIMFSAANSLRKYSERQEFKAMLDSGYRLNLNLITIFPAFFRRRGDPLRRAHRKIALIAIAHFLIVLTSIPVVWLGGAYILVVLQR